MFGSSYFFADFSVSLVDIRLGHVRMVVNCFEAKYKEFEPWFQVEPTLFKSRLIFEPRGRGVYRYYFRWNQYFFLSKYFQIG